MSCNSKKQRREELARRLEKGEGGRKPLVHLFWGVGVLLAPITLGRKGAGIPGRTQVEVVDSEIRPLDLKQHPSGPQRFKKGSHMG